MDINFFLSILNVNVNLTFVIIIFTIFHIIIISVQYWYVLYLSYHRWKTRGNPERVFFLILIKIKGGSLFSLFFFTLRYRPLYILCAQFLWDYFGCNDQIITESWNKSFHGDQPLISSHFWLICISFILESLKFNVRSYMAQLPLSRKKKVNKLGPFNFKPEILFERFDQI